MRKTASSVVALLAGLVLPALAAEMRLNSAGAPYAPTDISIKSDPTVPLSVTQRSELLSEFKGLVHMGLYKVSYDRWGGKEMADCEKSGGKEAWMYRCEIITGQGNGFYYFYPSENRQSTTLQALDIRLHASDQQLLDDFKKPVADMFGRAALVDKPIVAARPASPIREWSTTSDTAQLFIDRAVRPEGSVRFVWHRTPLVANSYASSRTGN